MDCRKVGRLIRELRTEKGLTQKELGDAIHVSDKTISKWERGQGCPNVSLLHDLSLALNINIEQILLGDLDPNNADGGNMKRLKFYVCPTCGNILTSTSEADLSCCGRKLSPLEAEPADDIHQFSVEEIDNDYYITFDHEMTKEHFINFVAYISYDQLTLIRLYPEQAAEVRLPRVRRGNFYFHCNQHGLFTGKFN